MSHNHGALPKQVGRGERMFSGAERQGNEMQIVVHARENARPGKVATQLGVGEPNKISTESRSGGARTNWPESWSCALMHGVGLTNPTHRTDAPRSISCWDELQDEFIANFKGTYIWPADSSDLGQLIQEKDESVRNFWK